MRSRAAHMGRRHIVAVVATLALLAAAACGGEEEAAPEPGSPAGSAEPAASQPVETGGSGTEPAGPPPPRGGVVRIGVETAFSFTGGFDPTGEYLSNAWQIYSNLLLRTLLNYRHVAGPPGNELIPDLAQALPEVSEDGLTYTFRLKDGIRFGPPLDREITSADVAYAFERIGTPSLVAQYGFYYTIIEGMAEFTDGKAKSIAGIETPDDKTIVFHLTKPDGNFLYLTSMPATAPMPKEVAGCFDEAGEYGRYVIASGPYMLEGSDQLDATSCDTLKPISGYDPSASMVLVRNPSYDPATDDTEARESLPDRFELTINTNRSDIYAKIKAGELEAEMASMPPKVLREYRESDELQDRLFLFPIDVTWYLSMNLTTPPFDDIHVRKAVNLVMDKEGLRRVWGGQLRGEIARHVVPDTMLNDLLADYDPYPSPDFAGDAQAAQDEMRQSKYDTDGDGMCDADACDEVLNVGPTIQTFRDMTPIIEDSLAKIGISVRSQVFDDPFGVALTVANNVPFTSALGWFKDFADAESFMVLFDSRSIQASGNNNHSLVGITPEQAAGLDGFEGNAEGVPSVDADIDRCTELLGDERVQCWADLDRKIMEEVVPWVPYLNETHADVVSEAVVQYAFDQFPAEAAYAHFAVDPSKQ